MKLKQTKLTKSIKIYYFISYLCRKWKYNQLIGLIYRQVCWAVVIGFIRVHCPQFNWFSMDDAQAMDL
jgi:hypothetical protein